MFNDPFHPEEAIQQQHDSTRRKLLGVVCAIAVTAALLIGYGYMRKRHAQRVIAETTPPPATDTASKGPPLAHVVVDEPTLEKGFTTIGGVVKNISDRPLSGISVLVDLRRRKDGKFEHAALPVKPSPLKPQEEGAYAVKFPVEEFASMRLAGLQADPQSTLIVYSSSQGKKRPPERLQPQMIVVKRSGRPGEFINTPDNPVRVP